MEKFRKLKVWQKAHLLVLKVYKITEIFPMEEKYGLVSQMRRAAISVTANIVEGTKRNTAKDKLHFLVMVDTSLEELKYYFILSYHLNKIFALEGEKLMEKARELGRMINGFKNSLKS